MLTVPEKPMVNHSRPSDLKVQGHPMIVQCSFASVVAIGEQKGIRAPGAKGERQNEGYN